MPRLGGCKAIKRTRWNRADSNIHHLNNLTLATEWGILGERRQLASSHGPITQRTVPLMGNQPASHLFQPTKTMNTTESSPIEATFEIVPAELGLDSLSKNALEIAFTGFFAEARKWQEKSETITDPKQARAVRLELKTVRVNAEKTRKALKEDSLRMGKAIDGANNILLALIVPIETKLDEIEKAEERAQAARIEALREERLEVLASMNHNSSGMNLGTMSEDNWKEYLQNAKDAFEARQARAKREAEEAAAELKRQEDEREAARVETIRLREEALANAKAAQAERAAREKVEAEAKAAAEKAESDRIAAETKARKEREAIEAKAQAEREAAAAVARAEQEKRDAAAKAERDKIEAAAAEERGKALESAAVAAREKAAADAEVQRLRMIEAKRVADEKAAADAKVKAEDLAAKKAAAAPDKQRILDFAMALRTLPLPEMKSEAGKDALDRIAADLSETVQRIRDQAAAL